MSLISKNGATWQLDDDLKNLAQRLINQHSEISHVLPQHVVFTRVTGLKAKWAGRTWYLTAPTGIITHHLLRSLGEAGLIRDEAFSPHFVIDDLLDLRFIIAINDAHVREHRPEFQDKFTEILLFHELMHIGDDNNSLEQHDIQDFKSIIDKYGVHWDEGIVPLEEQPVAGGAPDILKELNRLSPPVAAPYEESN